MFILPLVITLKVQSIWGMYSSDHCLTLKISGKFVADDILILFSLTALASMAQLFETNNDVS